ncbi:MAG: hypothetical protein B6U95_06575 [Thermofilum sp. ex4484_82]|nr:MAG: hypothetical protein B6U95_06575 [Thermofilum sp. ex4484_82]OYT37433.1 MAG: hypothetical protein B6U96_06565 [Archaeoglobales archaeon ex4484_92]
MHKSFKILKNKLTTIENTGEAKEIVTLKKPTIKVGLLNIKSDKLRVREYSKIIECGSGKIVFDDERIYVFPLKNDPTWGSLTPLIEYSGTQEVFVRGESVWATVEGKRYKIVVEDFEPEKTINRLAIKSGAQIDYSKPQSEAEIGNWRLYFKLPNPLLAIRLLTIILKPSIVAIVGPSGSGKTTLLTSLLNEIIELYPHLRISIIEQVREIFLRKGNVAYSKASVSSPITMLIRQSMRYERPDILVVGELRGEEIWSWIEAGRSGIAALTTYHAPNAKKAIFSMAELMRQNVHDATVETVLRLIDCLIVVKKYIIEGKIFRRVEGVYLSNDGKLIPVFDGTRHMPDERFREILCCKLMVGDFIDVYYELSEKYLNSITS